MAEGITHQARWLRPLGVESRPCAIVLSNDAVAPVAVVGETALEPQKATSPGTYDPLDEAGANVNLAIGTETVDPVGGK